MFLNVALTQCENIFTNYYVCLKTAFNSFLTGNGYIRTRLHCFCDVIYKCRQVKNQRHQNLFQKCAVRKELTVYFEYLIRMVKTVDVQVVGNESMAGEELLDDQETEEALAEFDFLVNESGECRLPCRCSPRSKKGGETAKHYFFSVSGLLPVHFHS